MPIAICGVSEVPNFAALPLDHIISFREVHQPNPDIRGFQYPFSLHSFVFADTGDRTNALAPTESDIQRLLSVYAQTRFDQNICFQCFAGVSRSTAAAFIWLVYHGSPYSLAYDAIVAVRGPFVCPNQLMVSLADDLMGHEGKMNAFMVAENGRRAPDREQYFAKYS